MTAEAFQKVKDQIGFCGIWCGSCPGGNGVTIEFTKKYEDYVKKRIRAIERWAPKTFEFKEFMKGLASIQAMPSCPRCRKGGGDPTCKIRTCASQNHVAGCSHCDQLPTCKHFEALEKTHPTIKENLRKIRNKADQELIKEWTQELGHEWPFCIMLCPHSQ